MFYAVALPPNSITCCNIQILTGVRLEILSNFASFECISGLIDAHIRNVLINYQTIINLHLRLKKFL
jgi:hypothetical protein